MRLMSTEHKTISLGIGVNSLENMIWFFQISVWMPRKFNLTFSRYESVDGLKNLIIHFLGLRLLLNGKIVCDIFQMLA